MFYSYCPNCFSHTESCRCENCGYDQSKSKKYDTAIKPENILNARYLVGRVLGKGGFGITYLAKDLLEDRIVAIKECLPESYVHRGENYRLCQNDNDTSAFIKCKKNFRDEISFMLRLAGISSVADVYDFFSENETEYFVMECISGKTLKYLTYVKNGQISVENAVLILFTVGSTLMEIHDRGVIHRDVSPENIMIDIDGKIKLIDFGAAKDLRGPSSMNNESIFFKPGFAPPEQYDFKGRQGEWTDVYSLGATFYTIVSGQPLVDSTFRLGEDTMKTLTELGCPVPQFVSDAVAKAMAPRIEDRYENVGEFLNDLADYAYCAQSFDSNSLNLIRAGIAVPSTNSSHAVSSIGSVNSAHSYNSVKFPYVEIVSGKHAGQQIKIHDYGFVSLGRDKDAVDLEVDDFMEISRAHCLVGYDRSKNRFIVIDKSHNGTFYSNGRRMLYNADSFLNPNDTFYMFSPELKVKVKLI